ncbi:hypothetical protein ACQY0O_003348 [Thecaphora frezii]
MERYITQASVVNRASLLRHALSPPFPPHPHPLHTPRISFHPRPSSTTLLFLPTLLLSSSSSSTMILSLFQPLLFALLLASHVSAVPTSPLTRRQAPGSLDASRLTSQHFGNDSSWYTDLIPLFDSSDPTLNAIYYYRWQLFRAHQRDLGTRGFISTEFLDDVGWQLNPWASLNDATGHHVGEARWLRDPRYAEEYLTFMFTGGNDRHFSDAIADTAYRKFLVDGDGEWLLKHLDAMVKLFNQWQDHWDGTKGLYYIDPLSDATEYTIASIDASGGRDGFTGGEAFRPSINSYMYAGARAIARISQMAGNEAQAKDFDARADGIKQRVQADLWNSTLTHFIDRFYVSNQYVSYWQPIRGRELVGLVPWMFDLPDDSAKYAAAWKHALSTDELKGPKGLRTVEPSYEHYMRQYRYEGTRPECQWNGPVWPFQTTQALLALGNLLDHYTQDVISKSDHLRLLREYAEMHYQGNEINLEEDYHPDTGAPIVGLDRSNHYFHSGFIDLVLSGLAGIRPQPDDKLVVNPLIDTSLAWFRVDRVVYHGHELSVVWDVDGSKYGQGAGLRVYLDGQQVAQSGGLERLSVSVPRRSAQKPERRMAKSIQLVRGQAPVASASSNTYDAEPLHEILDGRIWFFRQPYHGWTSKVSATDGEEHWVSIDFRTSVNLQAAEVAFFDDGNEALVPMAYRIQRWLDGKWVDVKLTRMEAPVPNGITNAEWQQLATNQLRVVMTQKRGKRVRVVEFKAF